MSIRDELGAEIISKQSLGRRNYAVHYLLSVAAVLASFFAGLSVALDWFGRDVLAVLSALPAAVLIASDRFNFSAKTKWYFGKSYALKGILSALEYEGLSEAEASKRRTEVDAQFEEHWPGIAEAPKRGIYER
jgi:hypothetical protein